MKALLYILLLLSFVACTPYKNIDEGLSRKEARELRRAEKNRVLQIQFDSIAKILESKQFVLEAQFLSNQRGTKIHVLSNLNFIKIDTSATVIQIGSVTGYGYNGVGGVTAEGFISNWKMTRNEKKKSFYIEMSVMTNLGIYDIFMSVYANGNSSAMLSGLRAGKLQYNGQIVPLELSNLFKGRSF